MFEITPFWTMSPGDCKVPLLFVLPTTRLTGSVITNGPSGRNVQTVSNPAPPFTMNLVSVALRGAIGDEVSPFAANGGGPQFPAFGPSYWHSGGFCAKTNAGAKNSSVKIRIVFRIIPSRCED